MTTEKMRVSASSVISSVAETSATPARCRRDGEVMREGTIRWMTTTRVALVAATVTWAGLLVVTPLLASRPHASPIASALILTAYGIGSLVCHQLPERSYHLWTAQMPVCARCAGIYFGAVAGAIAGLFRTGTVGARARLLEPRGILALSATPPLATLVSHGTTGTR